MSKLKVMFITAVIACSSFAFETVSYVDLDKYVGQWYEIASYPTWFQKNCKKSTAHYEKKKRKIKVTNTCVNTENGKTKRSVGSAWVINTETNAQLDVQFFLPFFRIPFLAGGYYIIMLGENYEYSVVSEPNMEYLWILSRTKEMDSSTLNSIKTELDKRGFDLSKLQITNR